MTALETSPAQRAAEGAWDGLRAEVEAELRHPVMASTGSGEVSADLLRRCLAALARVEAERDAARYEAQRLGGEMCLYAGYEWTDAEFDLVRSWGALRAPGEGQGDG